MRAITVAEHGGPEVLKLGEVPEPEPGPGEVRVRLEVAGVNFIDVYHRSGIYPTEPPFVPGVEGAGTVDALGDGVDGAAPGDRVAFALNPGSYAEAVIVPAARLVPVPDGVDMTTAAAATVQGLTAHFLAADTFPLREGHTALVHAAAGGVGLLLVQIAKLRGATVYATTSTEEKAALARSAGADEVIRYTEADFVAEVRRLTGGAGVDVVYDAVGRTTFDGSLACLRPRGYLVLYGQSSGVVPPVDPQRLNKGGSLYLTRPTLQDYVADRGQLLERAREVFGWIRDGRLDVRIGETHPLGDAAVAHRRLEDRLTAGKVLLLP